MSESPTYNPLHDEPGWMLHNKEFDNMVREMSPEQKRLFYYEQYKEYKKQQKEKNIFGNKSAGKIKTKSKKKKRKSKKKRKFNKKKRKSNKKKENLEEISKYTTISKNEK